MEKHAHAADASDLFFKLVNGLGQLVNGQWSWSTVNGKLVNGLGHANFLLLYMQNML